MKPYPTAQELVDEAEAVLFGVDNHHPLEADEHYIGVSNLVKKTAAEYAKTIIDRSDDEVHPLWGYIGNTLADRAMKAVTPYRECRVEVDIPDGGGWNWVGHMDGVTLRRPGCLIEEECKAYRSVDDAAANEKAYRQAMLYLALIQRSRQDLLPVADFSDDLDADAFPLAPLRGDFDEFHVRLWVIPRFGPSSITDDERPVKVWNVSLEQVGEVFDFYRRKTLAILQSVWSGDLEPALAWDRSPEGCMEFFQPIHEPPVVRDLEAERLAFEWAEAKDCAKVVKGRHEAALKAVLAERGSISPCGKKVSAIVGTNLVEARHPALTHLSIKAVKPS